MMEVKSQEGYGGYGNAVASVDRVKTLTFNEFMSWTMSHSQFDAVVVHNWTAHEKATHLLNVLHVPTEASY
jgi:hypothetical protein